MRCSELRALAFSYERGSHPTGSVTGCAARHEARHSPRLRLAPPCSQPRPRPGVAELGVVRRRYPSPMNESQTSSPVAILVHWLIRKGSEQAFETHWHRMTVEHGVGLYREMLTKPVASDDPKFNTF